MSIPFIPIAYVKKIFYALEQTMKTNIYIREKYHRNKELCSGGTNIILTIFVGINFNAVHCFNNEKKKNVNVSKKLKIN